MDCRVYTATDPSAVFQYIVKPEETLLCYDPPPPLPPQVGWASVIEQLEAIIVTTHGSKRLWKQRRDAERRRSALGGVAAASTSTSALPMEFALVEHLRAIQSTLVQLGPLCTLYFVDAMLRKRSAAAALTNSSQGRQRRAASMQEGAAAATERDAISEFLQTECVGHLQYVMQERLMPMTTPKIHALLKKLRQYHDKPQFRGIVFVDRRCVAHCAPVRLRLKRTNGRSRDVSCRVRPTAKALSGLLQELNRSQPEFSFLRCSFLVGHGTGGTFPFSQFVSFSIAVLFIAAQTIKQVFEALTNVKNVCMVLGVDSQGPQRRRHGPQGADESGRGLPPRRAQSADRHQRGRGRPRHTALQPGTTALLWS
jgi:hypothetical protein